MTVKELFTDGPLKGFKATSSTTLASVKGDRIGVDLSIFLYPWCKLDEYAIAATSEPRYDSQVLEEQIDNFHKLLSLISPTIVYVYEGKDLPLKKATKMDRLEKVQQCKQKLDKLLEKHKSGQKLSNSELNDVKKYRRGISAPDEIAYGKAIHYMKSKGMIVFGAPGEAEHQLVKLQQKKIIDSILTNDADLIPLGASRIIFDLRLNHTNVGNSSISLYQRGEILSSTSTFEEMTYCEQHLPEYSNLLGTDYSRRVPLHGPAKIKPFMKEYVECDSNTHRANMLLKWEANAVIQGTKKKVEQARNEYVASSDRESFVRSLDTSDIKKVDTSFIGWADNFVHAVGMFRYCPVFDLIGENIDISDSNSFEVVLAPLNTLPSGKTWTSLLGYDPEAIINIQSAEESKKVCTLQCLLRFDGRAPTLNKYPTYSAEENTRVAVNEPLPRYARLDFDSQPIEVQPTEVLIAWLTARAVHVLSDDRDEIEYCVRKSLENEKEVSEPELQPKDNPYHWFDVLQPTPRGNKFDQWCTDWIEFLPKLKQIDDEEFTRLFGKGANGIRERARGLIFDGNMMMNGIECINVSSRSNNDTRELVLFRTRCCPSMKTTESKSKKHLFYHIHICAEIGGEDGTCMFLPCPFSACSCENGNFICSHREAFVVGISLIQHYSKQGRTVELLKYFKAKEDPRLSQGKPILLENYTLRATSEHSTAQRKRKAQDVNTPARRKKQPSRTITP